MNHRPPRFYQIRIMESKNFMASYMARVQENEGGPASPACEIDCIFSNLDDSDIEEDNGLQGDGDDRDDGDQKPTTGGPDAGDFPYRLRIEGRVTLPVPVNRLEEAGFISERIREAYGDGVQVSVRRIRP